MKTTGVLLAAFVVIVAGCYMPITHTPRVDPGVELVGAYTLSYGVADSGEAKFPNPSVLLGVSGATRFGGGESAPALKATAQFSVWNGGMGDIYLQAPKRVTRNLDAGVGAAYVATPLYGPSGYLQVGHELRNGYYLFTTQAVMRMRTDREASFSRLLWQPTFAIQPPRDGGHPRFYFVTFTFGPTRYPCHTNTLGCLGQAPGAVVAVGLAASSRFTGTPRSGRR